MCDKTHMKWAMTDHIVMAMLCHDLSNLIMASLNCISICADCDNKQKEFKLCMIAQNGASWASFSV